ncbi:hypothetical protein Ddye_006795 [Dipteronia dyeriana]|uniref:BHLH domain-containing protein n=1 Tax=Dipteronia dyeriana TaxID=168575 RepID=A0AAD9XJ21_9ROSI|nr:hypothetical protein Ddye_006795 [Dipteronia dyeriana]
MYVYLSLSLFFIYQNLCFFFVLGSINFISLIMANLYGTTAPTTGHGTGEIAAFIRQLINDMSPSSSSCVSHNVKYIHSLLSPTPDTNSDSGLVSQPEDRLRIARSGDLSSSDGVNFSSMDSDTCDSEGPEASEVPTDNKGLPKLPSKRARAAEVHNLSEKKRRTKINEKMRALQNLVPNSNKTDKASMLDEAIEYLRQLQLQVQMLTMRNGLYMRPMWLPAVIQPAQMPQIGIVFDEKNGLPNTKRGTDTFPAEEEGSVQMHFNFSNQPSIPNQPIPISSAANISTTESSFGLEPLIPAQYGPFNLSSSKDIHDEGVPQLHLDANLTGKDSSSGMTGV